MKQGNPTIGGEAVLLNTAASAVADAARNRALSASLNVLVEKNVLGYPTFTTTQSYSSGETVFYDRRLYTFTSDHTAGAWDASQVEWRRQTFLHRGLQPPREGDQHRVVARKMRLGVRTRQLPLNLQEHPRFVHGFHVTLPVELVTVTASASILSMTFSPSAAPSSTRVPSRITRHG